MKDIFIAGGPIMWPLLLASLLALAIIAERLWTLQRKRVLPQELMRQVNYWLAQGQVEEQQIAAIRRSSPLGELLAEAIEHRYREHESLKERVEDRGRHVTHELGRYLNTLGTIADISPLLGLLGTVLGMIEVFSVIVESGVGSPSDLAGGISQALITTATGLTVAIPTLIAYRYLRGRVDGLVVDMERVAIEMVDQLEADRQG